MMSDQDENVSESEVQEQTEDQERPEGQVEEPQTKANAEAARYRHRLRETEAERDALAEQVTALRRAAVEDRLAAQHVPAAGFWASGVRLEELLDDDGNLDETAIKTAADNAVETLGLERVGVHMKPVPGEGRTTSPSPTPSWEAAFGPK